MDKVRPPAQKTKYKGYLGLWIYYGTWCLGVQGGCRWVNFGFGTLRRRHELCPLCLATQVSIIKYTGNRILKYADIPSEQRAIAWMRIEMGWIVHKKRTI